MTISTTARFKDMGNGTMAELMADQVQFFYDPTTEQARAIFNGTSYLNFGTAAAPNYHALGNNHDILPVDLSDKIGQCYGGGKDPYTGADLTKISVAGIMMIFKYAYDHFVNQRADDIAAAIAVAEAAAAAARAANTVAMSTSFATTILSGLLAPTGP